MGWYVIFIYFYFYFCGKDVLFWCPGKSRTSYGLKWVGDAFFGEHECRLYTPAFVSGNMGVDYFGEKHFLSFLGGKEFTNA